MQRKLATVVIVTALVCTAACTSAASKSSNKTDAESVKTLSYALGTPPGNWIPAESSPADTKLAYLSVPYESLLQTDAQGKVIPGLATKWTLTNDSLTLTLRDGVNFTDGTAFNADAVKANIEYVKTKGTPPNKSRFARVNNVEVLSPTEVKLDFSAPSPELVLELTRFAGLMVSPKALQNPDQLKTEPVGTGPYILDQAATVVNDKYVFDKNPKYWQPDAQRFEHVNVYLILDPTARATALTTGKVDAIAVEVNDIARVKSEGYSVITHPAFPMLMVVMDRQGTKVPAFKSQDVRQAMSYAIDRKTYFTEGQYGYGVPSNQWTVPGAFGYDANYSGPSYNVEKAKSLLAESGFTNVQFSIPSGGAQLAYHQPIVGYLDKVGIKMNIVSAPLGNFSGAAASGKYAAAILPGHELHPLEIYYDYVAKDAKYNPFHVSSPDVEALMSQVKGDDGPADQKLYEQMSQKISDDGILVPIGYIYCGVAWNPKTLKNVEAARWVDTCSDIHYGQVEPAK